MANDLRHPISGLKRPPVSYAMEGRDHGHVLKIDHRPCRSAGPAPVHWSYFRRLGCAIDELDVQAVRPSVWRPVLLVAVTAIIMVVRIFAGARISQARMDETDMDAAIATEEYLIIGSPFRTVRYQRRPTSFPPRERRVSRDKDSSKTGQAVRASAQWLSEDQGRS